MPEEYFTGILTRNSGSVKILPGCCQVTNVLNGTETLLKISIGWVGYTNVTDRRHTDDRQTDRQTTDGRTTTYSEHEHEFTFANKMINIPIYSCGSEGDLPMLW